jgi:hypothetical protein
MPGIYISKGADAYIKNQCIQISIPKNAPNGGQTILMSKVKLEDCKKKNLKIEPSNCYSPSGSDCGYVFLRFDNEIKNNIAVFYDENSKTTCFFIKNEMDSKKEMPAAKEDYF